MGVIMEIKVIDEKPVSDAETKALALKSRVDSLIVSDQASYDSANAINAEAYKLRKAFHEWFDPIDEASRKQRQATIAQGKKIDEPFDYVIKVTGSKASSWIRSEEEKARETKRIAEEAARKSAEDAQLKAAEELQAAGLTNAAEAVLEAPVVIPKIEVAAPKKADGTYYTDRYSAEVVDLIALIRSVVDGKAPLLAICANDAYLNQWARLTKGSESIPGVKVVKSTTQGRKN
jgi:hypothetical protein